MYSGCDCQVNGGQPDSRTLPSKPCPPAFCKACIGPNKLSFPGQKEGRTLTADVEADGGDGDHSGECSVAAEHGKAQDECQGDHEDHSIHWSLGPGVDR